MLKTTWPVDVAAQYPLQPQAMRATWRAAIGMGLQSFGTGEMSGGVRDGLWVLEELGYSACPIPLLDTIIANFVLREFSATQDLRNNIAMGNAVMSVAFGSYDGDDRAGEIDITGGVVNGSVHHVEGSGIASHLLTFSKKAPHLVILSLTGITPIASPGLPVPSLCSMTFKDAEADIFPIAPAQIDDLNLMARMLFVARAVGAAQRGFELVVEYSKERRQFGQPIGSFQAIQHKLADSKIALDGARLTLENAANCVDRGSPNWRVFASAAIAFSGPSLRQVALETQHCFGAIGYSEEHEAPRHFRRIHADVVRAGGARRAKKELAAFLLDGAYNNLPSYDLGSTATAFRDEIRAWLDANWTAKPETDAATFYLEFDQEVSRKLGASGWIGIGWPREAGGQARSAFEQLVFHEEMSRAGVPVGGHIAVRDIVGPTVFEFGTVAQKAEFLPKFLQGERPFCFGYSEPGAGSDLASLQATAVLQDNHWVINGQKLWTTWGDKAEYVFLAACTKPDAQPKQAGISVFLVPMRSPGISVRPSIALYGQTFSTVFYDNVKVSYDALLGGLNDGWKVINHALGFERISMGASVSNVQQVFGQLVEVIKGTECAADGAVRDDIGRLAAELEVARQLTLRSVALADSGTVSLADAAICKVYTSELAERIAETAFDILGVNATLSGNAPGVILRGQIAQQLTHAINQVIGGGTNEIQRSAIAQRGLGLPRS